LRTKIDKLNQKEKEALKKESKNLQIEFPNLSIINTSNIKNVGIVEVKSLIANLM